METKTYETGTIEKRLAEPAGHPLSIRKIENLEEQKRNLNLQLNGTLPLRGFISLEDAVKDKAYQGIYAEDQYFDYAIKKFKKMKKSYLLRADGIRRLDTVKSAKKARNLAIKTLKERASKRSIEDNMYIYNQIGSLYESKGNQRKAEKFYRMAGK